MRAQCPEKRRRRKVQQTKASTPIINNLYLSVFMISSFLIKQSSHVLHLYATQQDIVCIIACVSKDQRNKVQAPDPNRESNPLCKCK